MSLLTARKGVATNGASGSHDDSPSSCFSESHRFLNDQLHKRKKGPDTLFMSETQFQVFILNASRRLFSDRIFTSSFTKVFYSKMGVEWVMNNGPENQCVQRTWLLFHKVDPSPLKCVLRRTVPELEPELAHVVNCFAPLGARPRRLLRLAVEST